MLKLTITLEPTDMRLVRLARTHFHAVNVSALIRAALRAGLPEVVEDKARIHAPPPWIPKGSASPLKPPAADELRAWGGEEPPLAPKDDETAIMTPEEKAAMDREARAAQATHKDSPEARAAAGKKPKVRG